MLLTHLSFMCMPEGCCMQSLQPEDVVVALKLLCHPLFGFSCLLVGLCPAVTCLALCLRPYAFVLPSLQPLQPLCGDVNNPFWAVTLITLSVACNQLPNARNNFDRTFFKVDSLDIRGIKALPWITYRDDSALPKLHIP